MSWGYYGFRPYVTVGERRAKAQREMAKLEKQGKTILPVVIEGRKIATTFWGKAWCDNLESYMDYENRLPRGRTYVRNGSVVHLDVLPGKLEAIVSGSELYKVKIQIAPAAPARWKALCSECAGGIGSLVELLQGRFSDGVMRIITGKDTGLFPSPKEIKLQCSCPDWADMCKHVAAVLYAVGARLDQSPELLFRLRSVNHEDLITQAAAATDLTAKAGASGPELAESELGAVFGIELDTEVSPAPPAAKAPGKPGKKATPKTRVAPRSTLPAKVLKKIKKLRATARKSGSRRPSS